jgi:hypothetical protein
MCARFADWHPKTSLHRYLRGAQQAADQPSI